MAVVGVAAGMPAADAKLTGPARAAVELRCRSAVMAVGSPGAARSEIGSGKRPAGSVPTVQPPTDWYRGPVPLRFVAALAGTRAGRPTRILATVELKGSSCHLASWRVVTP
ncbi:MAG: hypothetical protein JF603_11365 [Acidobacteria bacterium]|nr:hypothetical protein [Acidobacteriota bacterium]